jgi:two-component system cell cycle sensor histidine kinase PleC
MTNAFHKTELGAILDRLLCLGTNDQPPTFRALAEAASLDPSYDFVGAALRDIDFRGEDLRGFDFSYADLAGADFRRANIAGVRFNGADLNGAIGLPEYLDLAGAEVTNLELRERKLMATIEDLRRSQQMLERQALELTDLAQKYADEKTRAEEANLAKSRFLAHMSHEFRTPLNVILGLSEIMESRVIGPLGAEKYAEYSGDIRSAANSLVRMVDDILDLRQVESGHIRLQYEKFELDEVFQYTERTLKSRAEERKIIFQLRASPNITLISDRRLLNQIVLNLTTNAIDFTKDGGRVTLRGRVSASMALITIADTGIGIPKEDLADIGKDHPPRRSIVIKEGIGSGLGLTVAMSLIKMLDGSFRIRSKQGRGTIVLVSLPRDGAHEVSV